MNYPPEISALIRRFKSVHQAEKAAGLAQGVLGKIRDGKQAYTELSKQKVHTAIENFDLQQTGREPMALPIAVIPDTCPPLIADLIKHVGSKYQARRTLRCSESTLKKIISRKAIIRPDWTERATAALAASPVHAPEGPSHLREAMNTPLIAPAPKSQVPEFVPWDGKSFRAVTLNKPGGKKTVYKKVPAPLALLLEKYVTASDASRALGMSSSVVQHWLGAHSAFDLKRQRRVHAALHGEIPTSGEDSSEQFDEYRLDLALVMCRAQSYDRIRDIADILNGQLKFKRNTPAGWVLIYRIKGDDARKFKRLAGRDALDITCP